MLYLVHPIFKRYYVINDHYQGELPSLGDALGRDCMVASFIPENFDFSRLYMGDGTKNENWFGWNAEVMSPINGIVKQVYINNVVNNPGTINPSRASVIIIESDSGENVMLAHVQDICVVEGQKVSEGQTIARVGNNGYSRCPHIHIGAWKDGVPMQISFDAEKVAKINNDVGEIFWLFGISEEEFKKRCPKR